MLALERSGGARLPREARERLLALLDARQEHLDGDAAIELLVQRREDGAHAAAPKKTLDDVFPLDPVAWPDAIAHDACRLTPARRVI